MRTYLRVAAIFLFLGFFAAVFPISSFAQAGATSGTITGTVTDPSGAVVAGATVAIQNPVTQYERSTKSDSSGRFQFTNVPYESYHMTVSMKGFGTFVHDVGVHSANPAAVPVQLSLKAASETVNVTSEDLINRNANMDTDIDRKAFAQDAPPCACFGQRPPRAPTGSAASWLIDQSI